MTISESRGISIKRALVFMGASWTVWTFVAQLEVITFLIQDPQELLATGGPRLPSLYLATLLSWYRWWLLTPLVFSLANRFRFEAGGRVRAVAAHLFAAGFVAVVNASVFSIVGWAFIGGRFSLPHVRFSDFFTYAAVCGAAWSLRLFRRERDLVVAGARLEAQLAESRLHALTQQLRPHFLYNALNSIAMLIRANAHAAALESVVGYGDLLRTVLDSTSAEVPLRHELAFVDKYLALERMRFPDTFSASSAVAADVSDAVVPTLILQPLIENALHHGLRHLESNARLEVVASRRDAALRIEVRDNGVGLPAAWRLEDGTGVGLRNTRTRLRQRYGSACHFELHSPAEGGTVVILEMPYQSSAAASGR